MQHGNIDGDPFEVQRERWMFIDTFEAEGLAQLSYMVGDESAGVAAVIDPRRDIDAYLDRARERGVRIVAAIETHIHADFVSGGAALRHVTDCRLCGGPGNYRYPLDVLADGEEIELGRLKLRALHTPGHTPEHVCLVASGGRGSKAPWAVFTGDTLFAGEVGRPDLLGEGTEEGLARALFHTLHEVVLPLGDELIVYPGHGKGSPCGGSIGDRLTTTLGYERKNNPRLSITNEDAFVTDVLGAQTPAPRYYPVMKKVNAADPAGAPRLHIGPIDAKEAARRQRDQDVTILDVREIEAFGGAHVPGSVNIPLRSSFPVWAGRLLDTHARILLVLDDTDQLPVAATQLHRIGIDDIVGFLRGGMRLWAEAGMPLESLQLMSVHELDAARRERDGSLQILDVRGDGEWRDGHVPGALHIELAELQDTLCADGRQLHRDRPVVTYCGSGFRAGIAASLLRRAGFEDVRNVPGSMTAWRNAQLPIEKEGG